MTINSRYQTLVDYFNPHNSHKKAADYVEI